MILGLFFFYDFGGWGLSLWVVEAMAVGVGSGNGLCFAVGFDGQWQWVGFRRVLQWVSVVAVGGGGWWQWVGFSNGFPWVSQWVLVSNGSGLGF